MKELLENLTNELNRYSAGMPCRLKACSYVIGSIHLLVPLDITTSYVKATFVNQITLKMSFTYLCLVIPYLYSLSVQP